MAQALMYPQAVEASEPFPEVRNLALPYSILGIVAVIGLQIALVYVWKLSALAENDMVFTDLAMRHTTGTIYGFGIFFATPVAIVAHLVIVQNAGGPGAVIFAGAMITVGVALTFVLLVMRDLLGKASTINQDLSEVI